MGPADQLTVARMAAAPVIVALFAIDFDGHEYWATALFAVAMATDWVDGWLAFAAAGAIDESIAWWALLVALVVTWVSGLDYARLAPRLLRSPA